MATYFRTRRVFPLMVIVPAALAFGVCYEQQWFNPYTTSPDNCQSYTVCPTTVLCATGGAARTPGTIANANVNCID